MRRVIPFLIVFAALLGVIRLFQYAQRFDPGVGSAPGPVQGAMSDISIRFGESEIISRTDGVRNWRLKADRIDLRRIPGGGLDDFRSAEFDGIKDGIFYRKGKPEATFSANRASYDQAQKRFDIRGKIRVKTTKGDRLESEDCVWSERDDYIRFPSGANGVFDGNRLSAPMLLYEPRKRTVQCPQGANGVIQGYPVHASVLFWDLANRWVDMPGPVDGERKGLLFSAQSAAIDLKTEKLMANGGRMRIRIEGEEPAVGGL